MLSALVLLVEPRLSSLLQPRYNYLYFMSKALLANLLNEWYLTVVNPLMDAAGVITISESAFPDPAGFWNKHGEMESLHDDIHRCLFVRSRFMLTNVTLNLSFFLCLSWLDARQKRRCFAAVVCVSIHITCWRVCH